MKKRLNQHGFTLMELMVVIVIVAILAAVAVPLYINYVKDAKRTEAKGGIAAVITAEQVYFQEKGTYVDDADLTDGLILKADLNDLSSRGWTVSVSSASATGFTVKAINSDATLSICCIYLRASGATWFDNGTCT